MDSRIIKQRAFTLIELLVVLAIIAIASTFIMPSFTARSASQERARFVDELNNLLANAWQRGLETQRLQRVFIDFNAHRIELQEQKEQDFALVRTASSAPVVIPEAFVFLNLYINKKDEMAAGTRSTAWFFVSPDGIAQPVIINIEDYTELVGTKPVQLSLVLNPFSVQMTRYEIFQHPH